MRAVVALLAGMLILSATPASAAESDALAGHTIVLDPGHQLGNSNPRFAKPLSQKKFNGAIVKPCNTTGTATNAGLPEATFNWQVAKRVKRLLEAKGAKVLLTRTTNSRQEWGPCIWNRPRVANRADADLLVSIHADGAAADGRGFHVIAPKRLGGWTDDIVRPSRALARDLIAGLKAQGLTPTTYLANPLSIRADESTLNFSDVPAAMVELGNMRNRSDARRMASDAGQEEYARGLAAGIERYVK